MGVVKIKKSGTFYQVVDDDSYILYYLLGYNVKNMKVGFPKSALNKVINTLESVNVSYEVVHEDIKNNFKKLDKYDKYRDLGFTKYNREIHYQNVIDKIKKSPIEKLDRLLENIEVILDE